ncbi:iron-sulfur cluster assembly 2 homolog, mitochondrial [Culicoides brevitarsis]|uniref:iron-sulfur cluster assembly 2 homolog, mitochondrial n=1 Tax=Culicoides brevitarsis TaxID=469753 RepID=UPI00307C89AD
MSLIVRNLRTAVVQSIKLSRMQKVHLQPHRIAPQIFNFSTDANKTTPLPSNQGLILTESCVARLNEICTDGSFLRITVEGGGCSGFQYKFDFDTKKASDDLEFGAENAKVVIDPISLEYIGGATIDYHVELIRAGFRILSNPKAEGGCSCGASFSLKID